MKSHSLNRKWTRRCQYYTQALQNTCNRLGIDKKYAEKIILKYIYLCKKNLMLGEKVSFPGILNMVIHHEHLRKLRRFMKYKQMKKKYGEKDYFKKHIAKKKT